MSNSQEKLKNENALRNLEIYIVTYTRMGIRPLTLASKKRFFLFFS